MHSYSVRCCVLLSVCGVGLLPASHAAPVIGGWSAWRAGDASLAEGAYGMLAQIYVGQEFPNLTYVGVDELTEEALAPFRMVALTSAYGWSDTISPPTAAEQQALFNYVLQGGSALLLADGEFSSGQHAAHTALVAAFGAAVTGRIEGETPMVVDPLASPVTNGPFGLVDTINMYVGGWFTSIGPYATPLAYASNNQPVLALIEPGKLGPGSGAVVMASDASIYTTIPNSGPILLNTVAYLVPEPSTLVLSVLAAAALNAMGLRRPVRVNSREPVRFVAGRT